LVPLEPLSSHTPEGYPAFGLTTADLLAAFLSGRNPRTRDAYRADLADFAAFAGASILDIAAQWLLSRGHGPANALALSYRAHLVERGLSVATINRRLAALRSLVKLARTLGLIAWTLDVSNGKAEPYRDTRGPGRSGFRAMLDQLEQRRDAKGSRDRAILRLLYDLALRRAEVVSLDVDDVDLDAGTWAVLGKGHTSRLLMTLPELTKAALRDWLTVRGEEPGPLFVNFDHAGKHGRLTATSVYRIVAKLGQQVGIKARPHGLRHAAITDALDLTHGDVRSVQKFSRHRSLAVLTLYDDSRVDRAGQVARLVAEASCLGT